MKQPDRFARVVAKHAQQQMAKGLWVWSDAAYQASVSQLLRAEHGAVVRAVKRKFVAGGNCSYGYGWNDALEEVLTWLAKRRK